MTVAQTILAALNGIADEGDIPSMPRAKLAKIAGMGETTLLSGIYELVRVGCIKRLELHARKGETGGLRITGVPAPDATAPKGEARREIIDDATIARRLRDRYGIEVVTYQRDRFSEAISLPRVRALEGPVP